MRLRLALIGVVVSAAVRACGAPPPVSRGDADTFRDSVGVNTHLGYDATPYADPLRTLAALRFLGVTRVRDSALREGLRTLPRYAALTDGGVQLDLFVNRGIDEQLARVDRLLARAPGALQSLEGPNEANHEPFDTADRSGARAAQAYQAQLYRRAHAWPRLARLPIFNLTYWPPLSGQADAANFHAYPGPRESIARVLGWQRRLASAVQPRGSAIVCTETGFTTAGREAISEPRQAELETILLLENFRAGVKQTFLYELFDEQGESRSSAGDREHHWGLFRYDGSPKPAALAVRRLMQVLTSAPGVQPRSSAASIILSGSRFRSLRLHRRDGAQVTFVWRVDPSASSAAIIFAEVASGASDRVVNLATGQMNPLVVGRNSVDLMASPLAFIETPAESPSATARPVKVTPPRARPQEDVGRSVPT